MTSLADALLIVIQPYAVLLARAVAIWSARKVGVLPRQSARSTVVTETTLIVLAETALIVAERAIGL